MHSSAREYSISCQLCLLHGYVESMYEGLCEFDILASFIQSQMLLGDTSGMSKSPPGPRPTALPHTDIEAYLSRYGGIMLYLREMEPTIYSKLCAVRQDSAECHTLIDTLCQ